MTAEAVDKLRRRIVAAGICNEYSPCELLQDVAFEAIALAAVAAPASVGEPQPEALDEWAGMDVEWRRLKRVEAVARRVLAAKPIYSIVPESIYAELRAALLDEALAADPQSPTGEEP